MLTEHEKEIRVYIFKHEVDITDVELHSRCGRLQEFIKHLGFIVSGYGVQNDQKFVMMIEPHKCSCIAYPYREKLRILDSANIINFARDNAMELDKIYGIEEFLTCENVEDLKSIESEINELVN